MLDPDERKICKHVLADEFFKTHAHDLAAFGEKFAKNSHKQNVETLAKAYRFELLFLMALVDINFEYFTPNILFLIPKHDDVHPVLKEPSRHSRNAKEQ